MTELEAIRRRHSIRKYAERPLDAECVNKLETEISRLNALGDLHMQLVVGEPRAFRGMLAYGVFKNVSNYVMVVGRKTDNLDFRAGYYTEALVLFAQRLGLNTCIVGLTYRKISGTFTLHDDEKVVVCIALGYGAEKGHKHKIKTAQQVSNVTADTPAWFDAGVEAALLAPTAVNQQKFYFEYVAPKKVDAKAGVIPSTRRSLVGYTKVDLGIAMYNFEIGAGKENFEWLDSPL